jgi:hypothetical protein
MIFARVTLTGIIRDLKKFSGVIPPDPRYKGRGIKEMWREERGGEGRE